MLSLIGVYTCELSKRRSQSVTPFYVLRGLTFCLDSFDLGYIGPQPKKLWIPWSYLSEGCWAESTCGCTTEACATHLIAGQRQATPSCLCARHVKSHPWHGCSILTLILSNPMAFPLKWTSSASNSWRFNFSPSRDCCELDAALKNNHLESPGNSIFIRTTTNHGARLNTAQAMRICKTTIDVTIVLSWRRSPSLNTVVTSEVRNRNPLSQIKQLIKQTKKTQI